MVYASAPVARVFMEPAPQPAVLRVLVVDDDADMRLYLRSCLRMLGNVRVHEAADGREALHLAHALMPDLVISAKLGGGRALESLPARGPRLPARVGDRGVPRSSPGGGPASS